MEIVGYWARIALAEGTSVLRFRDTTGGGGPKAGDGFLSSLLDGQGGVGNQMVLAGDGTEARLGATTPGASPLGGLQLRADPAVGQLSWRLVHAGVSCQWPDGTTVVAGPPLGPWKANMLRLHPDSATIHIQGPLAADPDGVPLPGDLVPSDHEVVDMDYDSATDQMWLDVSYVHDGVTWRQRHQYAPLDERQIMLVRAQAPDGQEARAWEALAALGQSLEPAGSATGSGRRSLLGGWRRRHQPSPVVKGLLDSWRDVLGGR